MPPALRITTAVTDHSMDVSHETVAPQWDPARLPDRSKIFPQQLLLLSSTHYNSQF
jgi:hypothetical protein